MRQLFVNCHKEDLIWLLKQCCALIPNSHTAFLSHICFSCRLTTIVVLYRIRSHSTRYQGVEGLVCVWNRVKNVPSCVIHTCYYIRTNLRIQSGPLASFCCHFQGVYAAWTVIYRWFEEGSAPDTSVNSLTLSEVSLVQTRARKGLRVSLRQPFLYFTHPRPHRVEVSWQCTVNIMLLWNEMGSWCRVVS